MQAFPTTVSLLQRSVDEAEAAKKVLEAYAALSDFGKALVRREIRAQEKA